MQSVAVIGGRKQEAVGAFMAGGRECSGTRAGGKAEQGVATALQPRRSRGPSASRRRTSRGEALVLGRGFGEGAERWEARLWGQSRDGWRCRREGQGRGPLAAGGGAEGLEGRVPLSLRDRHGHPVLQVGKLRHGMVR